LVWSYLFLLHSVIEAKSGRNFFGILSFLLILSIFCKTLHYCTTYQNETSLVRCNRKAEWDFCSFIFTIVYN